jgi:DtxR family transcriptional regulator, Mn-dependent transcriptional regulator
MSMPETESREMYLKSIYELSTGEELVPVSLLAKRVGVSPVSAAEMVKRLEEYGAITHIPYKGVGLTETGLQRALTVVRRQRLWGRFLADHLQISWSQVYDLSCRLEHATDASVTEALAEFLGNPTICPHGHPIPDAEGNVNDIPATPLNEIEFDVEVEIVRIDQPELILCEHLEERGLLPGTIVKIIDEAPFNGPFTLRVKEDEVNLGREISGRIRVRAIA